MLTGKNIVIKNIVIKNSLYSLENFGSDLTLSNSTFKHNLGYAGVLFNHCGKVKIINCKFIDNEAKRSGGAILNEGEMNISDSLFEGNQAYHWGGAICNTHELRITDSTFLCNYACGSRRLGGAIFTSSKENSLNFKNCIFEGNKPNDISYND